MNKQAQKILLSITLLSGLLYSCGSTKPMGSNMVAVMQVKEPIEGVCDNSQVYVILPIGGNGQVEAKAPLSDQEIEEKLNAEVKFLKDKPTYEDKGMVGLIINCKGEMVQCNIDNKTQSPELDSEIVAVFATMKSWSSGTMQGRPVDTSVLYSFEIKDGKISL